MMYVHTLQDLLRQIGYIRRQNPGAFASDDEAFDWLILMWDFMLEEKADQVTVGGVTLQRDEARDIRLLPEVVE